MAKINTLLSLLLLGLVGWSPLTWSFTTENLGTLSISDVLLRPSFIAGPSNDPDRGFTIGESSLAVQWDYEKIYSGHIRIGSEELIGPPAHYTATVNPNQIALVEAYAQYDHPYGRFRMGMLPLEFGLEGAKTEAELIFPRALLFEKRIVGLRDIGTSYAVDYNNFFTEFVIHNGEGGSAVDNNYWYTGRWGYKFGHDYIGLAGQTGHTSPIATQNSFDTLASVDPTQPAQWRLFGAFFSFRPRQILIEGEGYYGELWQEDHTREYITGHVDIGYEWTDRFATYLRYDALDPDLYTSDDAIHRAAVALVYTNQSRNSRLILMAAHDFNEGHTPDDQYRFIWSLSPSQLPSSF